MRRRLAIACQGGGSQCAFVAGALKTLMERRIHETFQIVGLSGTSGGALTAAVAWFGLLAQARGDRTSIRDRILAFWRDLTAQTPLEVWFDAVCIQTLRLVERGVLPSFANSPSSMQFRMWAHIASWFIGRPAFTDLRALLARHLDFEEVRSLVQADSPVLLVGACDIMDGTFKTFSSARGEIKMESLLASAAIPSLFPAQWVDGHAYWDGIFSSNPPVADFLRESLAGKGKLPDEIWVIQVNRSHHLIVPETPSDIFDRRNQLAGNLSLRHELEKINIANWVIRNGALSDDFRRRFGLDETEEIVVRFIRMSEDIARSLDYPRKLSRQPHFISRLMADGEAQASAFLASLPEEYGLPGRPGEEAPEKASEDAPEGAPVDLH